VQTQCCADACPGYGAAMSTGIHSGGLNDALVILGCAGIVIPAFARLRITPVIGFILVGILVGPFGLGALTQHDPRFGWVSISNAQAIQPFADLGIVLLLFSIGLELSFSRLWGMRKRLFGFGAPEMLGAGAVIGLALFALGHSIQAAIGLGLALALSSTALVLPIAGTRSAAGRLALAMLLFEDLALVPIIFLIGAIGTQASGFAELAWVVGLGALVVAAMLLLGRWLLPPLFAQAARTKSPELFLSASLLVAILASLATTAVGLSPIVGALVAGLLIAETDYRGEVETITAPFRGLALGIFLISVGMGLDLGMLSREWPQILSAVVGVVLLKTCVTAALLRLGRVRPGVAAEVGLLMASPSETTLIVLSTAFAAGLISAETAAFWQVVTALGLTITPVLARIGHDVARRIEWQQSADEADIPSDLPPHTLIIGYGRVGRMVADMLDRHDQPWHALESNIDTVTEARRAGKPVHYGDALRMDRLESLGLARARALVFTMDDGVLANRLTERVRRLHPDLTIIARARDPEHAAQLYRSGASDAVPETLESSLQLSEAVLVDLGVAMGPVIASIHEKREELRDAIKRKGRLNARPTLKSR
jgi:monovalent cation:H+ antiporter-2, CPA2 family